MSFVLPKLTCKREVDQAIKIVAEKVLVLRFGSDNDAVCLQLDDIVRDFFFFFNSTSSLKFYCCIQVTVICCFWLIWRLMKIFVTNLL